VVACPDRFDFTSLLLLLFQKSIEEWPGLSGPVEFWHQKKQAFQLIFNKNPQKSHLIS
jgi:hypothetical protein